MITHQTKDEFGLRYYRWSVADAQREYEQGLPLLRIVNGPGPQADLQYLESLAADERRVFMMSLVRNANGRALELLGEKLSTYEQELVRYYRDNIMPLAGRFLEQSFVERLRASGKVKKKRLARKVKEKLTPYCGEVVSQESAYLWTHLTTLEGWRIHTEIDMGGWADLRYWHSIVHPGETLPLKDVISLHSWLGLTPTEWSLVDEAQEDEAANSVEKLCRHFLESAPSLLKEISS